MIIPIRCWSCGKPIAHLWEDFKATKDPADFGKVMDKLGLERYCCRATFLGHVDLAQVSSKFKKA